MKVKGAGLAIYITSIGLNGEHPFFYPVAKSEKSSEEKKATRWKIESNI